MIRFARTAAAALAGLLVPALPVWAAGEGGFSLLGSFVQMIASLAVVIGVIYLVSWGAGKFLRNGPVGGGSRYIRLIETRHLGPKKSLMLVEVGGEYLLLGNSAEGVQLIKQVDMLEEIEVVGTAESLWGQKTDGAGQGRIGTFLNSIGRIGSLAGIGAMQQKASK